jgi:hypothetical protein
MTAVYGASPVSWLRRTRAELAAVDDAIIQAVETEHPVTLRGVFYRVVSAGDIESMCTFSAGEQIATAFFKRVAVTEVQVYELDLPTRPTKQSDSRARGFGDGSVEVDTIPPTVLRQIVEDAITQHIDPHQLEITQVYERSERQILTSMIGDHP